MKKELIEKLLKEQATPEEEHLIAQMLRQKNQENTDLWLIEDETETYDRLVNQRHARRRLMRWSVAAIFIALIAAGAIVLWPNSENPVSRDKIAIHKTGAAAVATPEHAIAPNPTPPIVAKSTVQKPVKAKAIPKATNTADSLQIYIERLEQELAQLTDSSYTAKAEQIIRADARLQRLVQRIMIGEIERNGQPIEALINNEGKEVLP